MTRLISILLLFCCGLATASLPRDAVRLREALTAVANNGQGVIQERDANNTVLVTYTRGLDQGRNQAVGSVPLAGSFSPRASLFAAYRSMKDMRAAHASSGAKIYGAIVDLPTSWSRLSQTLDGAGGIGGLLARTHPGNHHFYYHADANGNVTAIVNQKQTLVAQYRYDPFGGLVSQSGPLAEINLYRFSSKEFHQASGLYYYGYRFYDPNLQRWLNRDPIGEEGGINLHQYVHNDPLNLYDPLGEAAGTMTVEVTITTSVIYTAQYGWVLVTEAGMAAACAAGIASVAAEVAALTLPAVATIALVVAIENTAPPDVTLANLGERNGPPIRISKPIPAGYTPSIPRLTRPRSDGILDMGMGGKRNWERFNPNPDKAAADRAARRDRSTGKREQEPSSDGGSGKPAPERGRGYDRPPVVTEEDFQNQGKTVPPVPPKDLAPARPRIPRP